MATCSVDVTCDEFGPVCRVWKTIFSSWTLLAEAAPMFSARKR